MQISPATRFSECFRSDAVTDCCLLPVYYLHITQTAADSLDIWHLLQLFTTPARYKSPKKLRARGRTDKNSRYPQQLGE